METLARPVALRSGFERIAVDGAASLRLQLSGAIPGTVVWLGGQYDAELEPFVVSESVTWGPTIEGPVVYVAVQLRLVIRTLRGMAAAGDVGAAKALIPFLNQGLGMPTETVRVEEPASVQEVQGMSTAALAALVKRGRPTIQAVPDLAEPASGA